MLRLLRPSVRYLTSARQVYKRSTHPTSVPLNKLFASRFPLLVTQSFKDYAVRDDLLTAQSNLLSTLPFFPKPDESGRSSDVIQTMLKDGNTINEFVIYPSNYSAARASDFHHLIMVHGYGGGLGFFLKNFDAISQVNNWVVHSIDLLGYGCSSRPKFTADSLEEVEAFFHDSFEEWLAKRGLNDPSKVLVMAHSMGAYLMATYGINRNPAFCKKLLMVSPGAVLKHRKPVPVPSYFAKLWERNILPFTLVRKAGPLGSKLVSMWLSRRFAKLSQTEAVLLHKYAYSIFQARGLGEYMLNYLLAPGADARHPLISRGIHKLKCEMLWVYGKEDWMDRKGGELVSNILNNLRGEQASEVKLVSDSGHHIYLDNIGAFNRLVASEMTKMGGPVADQ